MGFVKVTVTPETNTTKPKELLVNVNNIATIENRVSGMFTIELINGKKIYCEGQMKVLGEDEELPF